MKKIDVWQELNMQMMTRKLHVLEGHMLFTEQTTMLNQACELFVTLIHPFLFTQFLIYTSTTLSSTHHSRYVKKVSF